MPQIEFNYLAVVVAAIVSMVIGSLWYSPMLFGKKWMKLMGWSPEEMEKRKKGMGMAYLWMFIGSLVMAYVLSYFLGYSQAATLVEGAWVGFWAWLGFVAPVMLGGMLWEGKPKELYLINSGHNLVNLLVMGAILAVWR